MATNEGKGFNYVIYKDLEPGVINNQILEKLIVEQGPKGEAGRLFRMEKINFNVITVIRIEFQNLLKVDHLWTMPNLEILSLKFNKLDKIDGIHMLTKLKNLDLSFNFIEKIENLEKLINIEILSLFNNKIKKLENLDNLEKLYILSVGNNEIDTFDGIERLRFMKELFCLNLEGNPIASKHNQKSSLRIYVSAFLPQLKYYNYAYIQEKEREKGLNEFRLELQQLEKAQLEEIQERQRIAKEISDENRLSSSFVELLNEHQLFESMFHGDEDGRKLLSIGEEVDQIVSDFRDEVYELTQQIYELGLEKHELRLSEITMFEDCINKGKLKAQQNGIEIVNIFMVKKDEIIGEISALFEKRNGGEDQQKCSELFVELNRKFEQLIEETWQILMEIEISIFERVEEANTQFGHTINSMLNEFIELAQTLFVRIRDAELNYSDSIMAAVSMYITDKAAANDEMGVPIDLRECLEDKDAIGNLVAGSRDYHMQKIDSREDRLVTRGKTWATELVANMQSNEIKRNRNKVTEIQYFLEQQRKQFDNVIYTEPSQD